MSRELTEQEQRAYDNFTMIKALEEVDEKLAIELVSDGSVSPDELSEVLMCHLAGKVVNKETKEPSKLSENVAKAILKNVMLQKLDKFEKDNNINN
jgi:hypothetical protein